MLAFILYLCYVIRPYAWFSYMCIMRIFKDCSKPKPYYMDFFLKNYIWFTNKLDYYILVEINIEMLFFYFILSTIIAFLLGKYIFKHLT
jgi:hypothetical protein